MPKTFPTEAARVAAELRANRVPARVAKYDPNVITIPTYGPDDVLALRLIYPALQNLTVQVGLTTIPNVKKS